jgi:glycosyl transferase family 61
MYPSRSPSKVEILSQFPCPPLKKRAATLFYKSSGERFVSQLQVSRPTYFDEVILTKTHLERQRPPELAIAGSTLKQLAKSSLRRGQRAAMRHLPAVELEGPILDFRTIEANNIAHLMMSILPYCVYAQQLLGRRVNVLLNRLVEPYLSLAARFGVSPMLTARPVSGEFLQYFGTRGLAVYQLMKAFDCDAIHFLPWVYDKYEFKAPTIAGAEKLFVARRGTRALRNHKEVEQFLAARGYSTVYFEDYTIEQQLSLGANARSIVAIHGAAMSFFIVGSKLDSVVELLPPHVYHQLFAVALPQSVASYKMIIPDFNPDVGFQGWGEVVQWKNKPFEADMELLEDAVDALA